MARCGDAGRARGEHLAPVAVALSVLAAGCGGADEVGELDTGTFLDGERVVGVERLAPEREAPFPDDGSQTPVLLRYPDRAEPVRALVDRTAIVKIDPGAEAALVDRGARLVRPLMPSIGLWLVEPSDEDGGDGVDLATRLGGPSARSLGVRSAIPNLYLRVRPTAEPWTPNDPRFPGQWYFENLGMPSAWGLSVGDASQTIVVIDTGCDLAHPDLAAKLDPGLDVVDGDADPSYEASDSGASHGTACAGIVAAATNNGVGIAGGCPECRLRCVRMLSDVALPTSATVDAFQFAFDTGAAVVSNSWGFVDAIPAPQPIADAIGEVFDNGRGGKGALVLFAMGNDDRTVGDDELQAARGVLGIGAINNFDESTPFTNSGNSVDVVAPTGTLTTDISGAGGDDPTDYTSLFGGTSSACPVAAGVAGLLTSAAPDKTAAELYDVIIRTARPAPYAVPDENGHDPLYGFGIIQPEQALMDAMGLGVGGAGGGGAANSGAGGALSTPASDTPPAGDEGCACRAAGTGARSNALVYACGALVGLALGRRKVSRRRRR